MDATKITPYHFVKEACVDDPEEKEKTLVFSSKVLTRFSSLYSFYSYYLDVARCVRLFMGQCV